MRSARSVTTFAAGAASILALTVASLGLPAIARQAAPAAQPQGASPAPAAAPQPATPQAQANPLAESVAAVVNDDIISSYDVVQRMRLLMATSGMQPTQENLPQIEQEDLRSLIDERLEMQELKWV